MATPTPTMNAFIFRNILHRLSTRNWEEVEKRVQPTVEVDGYLRSATEFFDQMTTRTGAGNQHVMKLDLQALDVGGEVVAARIINRTHPSESPEGAYEYQEIVFAWFVQGRLSKWKSLHDEDGARAHTPTVPTTSHLDWADCTAPADDSFDLKQHYRAYIASINQKTMAAEFGRFCQPLMKHNDRELSTENYIPLISDSQDAIEGLHFHIEELVADRDTQRVAAMLEFTGKPVRERGGAQPNGKTVKFHEHVLYQLHEGKIKLVWSVIEMDSYREQLR